MQKKRLEELGYGEDILSIRLQNFCTIDEIAKEVGGFDFILADLGAFTLAPGAEAFFSIAGDGNIEIASGVTLEEGATYRLTLDVTAGKDNPVLSLVKK